MTAGTGAVRLTWNGDVPALCKGRAPARPARGHAHVPQPAPTKESVMVQPGFFVLHLVVLPPLPACTYTLHGQVEDVPTGPVAPLDSTITVSSPRWTMPPDEILFTFPPANSEGAYRATLPQIVLKRRTLPWERTVWTSASPGSHSS